MSPRDERQQARASTRQAEDELAATLRKPWRGQAEKLKPAQRDVLSAQWRDGLRTHEIARAHGKSENAVRLLRSRGLAALRAALVEPGPVAR